MAEQAEQTAQVLRAERFELVDASGAVRAALALDEEGNPGLILLDSQGVQRASLSLMPDGSPRITLYGKTGLRRASLGFGTEWKVGLILADRHQQVLWSAP